MNNTGLLINNTDETVTYQHRITDTNNLHHLNVENVVVLIRSGGNYKSTIMDVRTALSSSNKKAADLRKKQLPAVLFSGEFSSACGSGLVAHSGLLVVDFDDVPPDEIQDYKQELANHPSTRLVFISPSGKGLKWVVAVSATDGATHKRCFELCVREVAKLFPGLSERLDMRCSDVSRRCFMSFDPQILVRNPTVRIDAEAPSSKCDIEEQMNRRHRNSGRNSHLVGEDEVGISTSPTAGEAVLTLQQRVARLVPQRGRQNDDYLFQLGRLCRDLEMERGLQPFKLPIESQKEAFQLWLALTPQEFRRFDDGDYWDEFTQKFYDAKQGLNCVPWRIAWERSRTEPPPDWWRSVIQPEFAEEKRLRLLTMLALQAEITRGEVIAPRHQIASAAKAEGYTKLDKPEQVQRVLNGFRPFLKLVSIGSHKSRRASIYQLQIPVIPTAPSPCG